MTDVLDQFLTGGFGNPAEGASSVLLAMLVAFCIGHVVAWVYMWTHEGVSYSRMFTASLLAMPVLIALVMVVMAGSIFVAFGLLAVFTVVRFRNVLKDTRDTTFVLWAIVEGMACGTMRLGLAVLGAAVVAFVFLYLWATMFGGRHRYDVVVTLQARLDGLALEGIQPIFKRHSIRSQLASRRELDEERQDLSYHLMLRDPARAKELVTELQTAEGVDRVAMYRREDESEI